MDSEADSSDDSIRTSLIDSLNNSNNRNNLRSSKGKEEVSDRPPKMNDIERGILQTAYKQDPTNDKAACALYGNDSEECNNAKTASAQESDDESDEWDDASTSGEELERIMFGGGYN
jgi:hypothetical protein